MSATPHPDQSWEAILNARTHSVKNPAPPVSHVPFVGEHDASVPEPPKPGQPGYAYPKQERSLTPEELVDALKAIGFDDLRSAVEGLRLQNETLREENDQLAARVTAAESALRAARGERTSTDGVTDADFEELPPGHVPDINNVIPPDVSTDYYKGD